MPCYHPLQLKRHQLVPCGQCIGCRLERSRQTAVRCLHERQLHAQSSFITMTYSPDCLPAGGSLSKRDLRLFWRRLRKHVGRSRGIRYLSCGEYGDPARDSAGALLNPFDNFGRPHYHAIVFGWDPADREYLFTSDAGFDLDTSLSLSEVWGNGRCLVGDVTFESAAYVARYCMKKINGEFQDLWYQRVDLDTGEILPVQPEFSTRSLKPGLGQGWLQRYMDDVYPSDEVIVSGRSVSVPRYYDKLLEMGNPVLLEELKRERVVSGRKAFSDQSPSRRKVRETVKQAQVAFLKREIQ